MKRVLAACLLVVGAVVSSGCSQDVFSSETQFVCDSSADCAQGFECAQTATSDVPICVPASRVGDAGALCNDGDPPETFFEDADDDGFGDPKSTMEFCVPDDGWVEDARDCDDSDPTINPGAPEVCNGLDNDCDERPDIPAEGDPVCPRLVESLTPGDLSGATAASGPDGSAYVFASYRGSIELGDASLTTQSNDAVLFEVAPDGSIGWVSEISSASRVEFRPIAVSGEYVAIALDVDDALTVGGLDIPAFEDGFASRVVVALVDKSTGNGLAYEQLSNTTSLSSGALAFDDEGDLWTVMIASSEIQVGSQSSISLESDATIVTLEFTPTDDAITFARHTEWRPGGEPASFPAFSTGARGAYLSGQTSPDSGSSFIEVAHFQTDATSLDLSSDTARIAGLEVSDIESVSDGEARLCAAFADAVTIKNQTLVAEGGLDALLAEVRRGAAQGLDVEAKTQVSSVDDIECTYLAVLDDGSDVSVFEHDVMSDLQVGDHTVEVPPDRDSVLLVGRSSEGAFQWSRQLLGTNSPNIQGVAPLGSGRFAVVGATEGRIEVSGEMIGTEDEPNGFLLIYENP
jgi:hypothetical protein